MQNINITNSHNQIMNSQNAEISNDNYILFGENGVERTFVPQIDQTKQYNKKLNYGYGNQFQNYYNSKISTNKKQNAINNNKFIKINNFQDNDDNRRAVTMYNPQIEDFQKYFNNNNDNIINKKSNQNQNINLKNSNIKQNNTLYQSNKGSKIAPNININNNNIQQNIYQNNSKIFKKNISKKIDINQSEEYATINPTNETAKVNENPLINQNMQSNYIIKSNNMIQNNQINNQSQIININDLNPSTKQTINQNKNKNNLNKSQNNNSNDNNNNNNNNQINQNNNNNINPNTSYSFSRYKKAAKTGLVNMGNTSYLNSTLQLLCSIRSLASFFLNPKNGKSYQDNIKSYALSFVTHRLCTHIYPYPERDIREKYTPDSFKEILGSFNVIYKDNKEKDPNELIIYIFNRLNDELTIKSIKNDYYMNNNNMNIISDKNAVINNELKKFGSCNSSIIFNYFTWFEIKELNCNVCYRQNYKFQNFKTFELNVLFASKYKQSKNVKISDCLDFYSFNKNQKAFCPFCNSYNEAMIKTNIYISPNIFVFLLDIKNIKEEENIKFIVEQKINLDKYIENKGSPRNYELHGIVFFDKKDNKYKALCISPVDKQWYIYDDEEVNLVNYDDFISKYNEETSYMPSILVYNGLNS